MAMIMSCKIIFLLILIFVVAVKCRKNTILGRISDQIDDGQLFSITGTIKNGSYIAFQNGDCSENDSDSESCDIALKLEFCTLCKKFQIIRNSYEDNNGWTKPQMDGGSFLKKNIDGQEIDIKIVVRPEFYIIKINQYYFCSYKHVIPTEKINHIRVTNFDKMNIRLENFLKLPNRYILSPMHGTVHFDTSVED